MQIDVDGGSFIENPGKKQRFVRGYFSVLDGKTGKLIHFEKNIGDVWSGVSEYMAIKWAVENIISRPLKITSDCRTAMKWANKGANTKLHKFPKLNLIGVSLEYKHNNSADIWNAKNWSPKFIKGYAHR